MRADLSTSSAADTFFGGQRKRRDIFQISMFHSVLLYTRILFISNNTSPAINETAISGTAVFISLTTPEKEVYVDEPVKFIAKKADNDGNTSKFPMARSQNPGENQQLYQINPNVQINPSSQPFHAKALPGITGRSNGVKKVPVITAPVVIFTR